MSGGIQSKRASSMQVSVHSTKLKFTHISLISNTYQTYASICHTFFGIKWREKKIIRIDDFISSIISG